MAKDNACAGNDMGLLASLNGIRKKQGSPITSTTSTQENLDSRVGEPRHQLRNEGMHGLEFPVVESGVHLEEGYLKGKSALPSEYTLQEISQGYERR